MTGSFLRTLIVVVPFLNLVGVEHVWALGFECTGADCGFIEGRSRRNFLDMVEEKPKAEQSVTAKQKIIRKVRRRNGVTSKKNFRNLAQSAAVPVSFDGNLPVTFAQRNLEASDFSSQGIVQGLREPVIKLQELRYGDTVTVMLDQAIKASPASKSPIRVTILGGSLNGSLLIGDASLDRELKRVFLDFDHLRVAGSDELYDILAEGLSPSGMKGLEGDYHSEEGLFLLASFVGAFLGNLTDAQVNRVQTAYGGWTAEPSLPNAAKVAGGATLVQGANRLSSRAEHAPEYTQVEGHQTIRVFIKSDPTRKL